MESSQPVPAAKISDETDANNNLRRLLLYEVLLEEYESHCPLLEQPEEGAEKDVWAKLAEKEVNFPAEPIQQPPLSKKSVDGLRDSAQESKRQLDLLSDDRLKAEFEDSYNGALVSTIFNWIVKAQKKASEHKFRALTAKYDEELKKYVESHGGSYTDEQHKRIVEKAVIADVQGVVNDYREQFLRERMETDGIENSGTRKLMASAADQFAFQKVIQEEQSAADNRDPTTSDQENIRQDILNEMDRKAAGPKTKNPDTLSGLTTTDQTDANATGGEPPNDEPPTPDDSTIAPPKEVDRALNARRLDASTRRSALCLSGGGIRSATFNLGILQGLARHGLLGQFDYLSTVSGGGFAGSFLTAWMHRAGTKEVLEQLTHPPRSPLVTEPHPIDHLRVFGNYLSLRPGLLSADTWTLVATVLRNLLLTWFVFVPFLLLMLMVPRFWAAILAGRFLPPLVLLVTGVVLSWVTLGYTTYALGSEKEKKSRKASDYTSQEGPFLMLCLVPAILAAMAFTGYWADPSSLLQTNRWLFVFLMLFLVFPVWIVGYLFNIYPRLADELDIGESNQKTQNGILRRAAKAVTRHMLQLGNFALRLVTIVLSQIFAGLILYVIAVNLMPSYQAHPRLYATFAVPLLLLVLAIDCTLIAGFSSGFTKDDDQEWWARFSAWFLIAIVGWSASHLLVLYGPEFVLSIGYSFNDLRTKGLWNLESLETLGKILAVLAGIVSGVITLFGGFSVKSPANNEKANSAGASGRMLDKLTSAVAPIFLGFLIILLAIGTDALLTSSLAEWLIPKLPWLQPAGFDQARFINSFPKNHVDLITLTPLLLLVVTGILISIVGTIMGLLINSNTFSLHYMWRNRIIRAYLGASRLNRSPDNFTGFDTDDNIHMHELRPQPKGVTPPDLKREASEKRPEGVPCPTKLFHIVNVALNLAGGDKLAWQDRKAESLTISPFHVGSYWLGYRRAGVYGGERGISLGTAVAISGAFVSPNMGYMMTSPIVRFLMTLFNVRFGWWLGNPGAAGDKTYWTERIVAFFRNIFFSKQSGKPFELKSPLLSVKPIVQEAFGKTNDKAPYVYLSDGGHFENLGLYEMVLRRCRFIVVSDASTDSGYSFDSLAQSIRQIRVDLGIPIDIQEMSIIPPSQDLRGKYCAIGKIRYSCVDLKKGSGLHQEDFDGILIYIKASMIGNEPRDVINYEQASNDFPQEIIVDQWFSESQFESYRALGSHIIDAICGGDQNRVSLAAFGRKVKEHNRVNFRVFKDQISLAALEDQFKRAMLENTPQVYKDKVKEYLRDLLDLK